MSEMSFMSPKLVVAPMVSSISSGSKLRSAGIVLMILVFGLIGIKAQPQLADTVFAEAKSLAGVADSAEKSELAFVKFDEAARLYGVAGNSAKVADVELAHGRSLRQLAVSEMNAGRRDKASSYFQRALKKFRQVSSDQDTAFAYDDLG